MRDSTNDLRTSLGPSGSTLRSSLSTLGRLYRDVKDEPEVRVRFREWQSYLSIAYGETVGDEELFARHTYLAILARLIALYHIQPNAFPPGREEHVKVINGEYFRERDIYNFVEEDFFTWVLNSKVLDDSLDLVRGLIDTLASYDFANSGQELLQGLYRDLVDPVGGDTSGLSPSGRILVRRCTPESLSLRILSEELKLQDDPDLSLLDPACGSGTFLVTAIRLIREGMARRGEDEFDTLLHIISNVMAMDVHPLAVTIARTNYLLALGDLIRGPHPPVLVPVYLANAIQLPEATTSESHGGYSEPLHTISTSEPNVVFQLPDSVVSDPAQLDWLFHRLAQYLHAAEFRSSREGVERATEEVINSLYSYLTSPKRAGLRQLPPLSPFAAGMLCQTARSLINAGPADAGNFWLHILKNTPAPVYLSRRKFDLVVSNPAGLSAESSNLFFARSADLYLRDGGTIAVVMPRTAMEGDLLPQLTDYPSMGASGPVSSGQADALRIEKVIDLDRLEPQFDVPSCVVVARKEQPIT